MRSRVWICAVLAVIAAGPVAAQEQQASLRRIEVPDSTFDIMLAMPRTPGAIIDLAESPDALVLHLAGGKLALSFESAEAKLEAIDTLRTPVGASQVHHPGSSAPQAVAFYIVPKPPATH
jgi:hypothetical protein